MSAGGHSASATFLGEAYEITEPGYEGRFSVPVLRDTETGRIVSNESGDILRMFSPGFGDLASAEHDLYPEPRRDEIDELNRRIFQSVNDAVYQLGFTCDQEVYESAVYRLFDTLDELDDRLASRRFLFGEARRPRPTGRCSPRSCASTPCTPSTSSARCAASSVPAPLADTRDLYQQPGIGETVRLEQIRNHYYRTRGGVNPSGLVAVLPRRRPDEATRSQGAQRHLGASALARPPLRAP